MQAGKRNITEIFNRARTLEIPFFQREYVWKKPNWERFLEDIWMTVKTGNPYFLGSIIQKQRRTNSRAKLGDVRSVVDGQQRLTTLMIFFKVVFDARNEDPVFQGTFRTFANDWILKHNHADIEAFEAVLTGTVTDDLRIRNADSQVLAAYDYFQSQPGTIAMINPVELFNLIYFVGIDLDSEEDEQQIFDTINSLGVALTTAELLKNELFGREDLALYNATWKPVFELDPSTRLYWGREVTAGRSRRAMVDLFLQSFLLNQDGVGDEVRVDSLFAYYKTHLKQVVDQRETFTRDLTHSAQLYRDHVRVEVLDEELDVENAMERLNVVLFGLNTTTVFPYVLYILRTVEDSGERARMFRLLEAFLLRRLICKDTTKNYNKFFTGFTRAKLDSYDALVERLTGATDSGASFPTDVAVATALHTSNLTNGQARLVLYMLERSVRDDGRQSTALNGLKHYTLEHLMPKKWRNYWGKLPPEQARIRDETLRKLGNLSLLSSKLNTSIRDADWATKKVGRGRSHGLDRYASGLETLAEDLALPVWDEATIRARGDRLAKQALIVWPHPAA